jgi:hypothetical protein
LPRKEVETGETRCAADHAGGRLGVRKAGPAREVRGVRETERSLVREVREVRAKLQMCQTKHTPSKKTVGC